jgi:hypothetical protein
MEKERNNEPQDTRNDIIVEKILAGVKGSKLAEEYGITRQRIWEIFNKYCRIPDNLISANSYAKIHHLNKTTVIYRIKRGDIKGTKIGNKFYAQVEMPVRMCPICRVVPLRDRQRYCSDKCRFEALKEAVK